MALKTSSGKTVKKQKVNIVDNLYNEEINKKNNEDRKETFAKAHEIITRDVAELQTARIPISSLYAAPFNKNWNDFSKLSADAEYTLDKTIVDEGLLTPIIVWKINKDDVKDLYENDKDNPYDFAGSEYMILAGHSRVGSYNRIYGVTNDAMYLKIDAIIKHDISHDQARYIIKVTNFASRELTTAEKRRNTHFFHRTLSEQGLKGSEIARKIAEDSKSKLRTVQYYIKINENLIPEIGVMLDDEQINQTSAYKICKLTKDMQTWLYNTYKDSITDNVIRGLKDSYHKREQIEKLFVKNEDEDIEYVVVNTDVPKKLEKKFRTMVSKWINKNM